MDQSAGECFVSIQHLNGSSILPGSKPRPITVVFTNPQIAETVLRKKKSLSATQFRDISISDDKTPKQIQVPQRLREELRNRIRNGEKNLTIRYERETHAIVIKQPKNRTSH